MRKQPFVKIVALNKKGKCYPSYGKLNGEYFLNKLGSLAKEKLWILDHELILLYDRIELFNGSYT